MVWIQVKERFHGKTYVFWKKYKSVAHAQKEHRNWNGLANKPRWEHLSIVRKSKSKPTHLKRGAPGIYHQTKRTKIVARKRKRTSSSGFGFGGLGFGFKKPKKLGWLNW